MARNVCIVRQNYFPAEAHVRKNVDALVGAGFRVDVVCLREKGARAREEYRGGTICRLPLTHRRTGKLRYLFEYVAFFAMAFGLLAYRSLRRRYDLVEVYNMPDFLVFAALPARLRGAKVILYLFELMPELARDEYALPDAHPIIRLLRWIERRSVRFADRVIVVGPYDERLVQERSRPRLEPAVVLNVPDEALFALQARHEREDDGAFRLLTHGSLLERYGIQTLIRAIPLLVKEAPNIEVWIAGDGEYRETLVSLAKDCGVGERVRFLDWMPIEEIPACIAQADVGVVLALVPWLLPNKLFEYVAMGKPVVASASPSIASLFDEEAVAYFYPDDERDLARRILELHADPGRARRQAAKARQAYQPYAWTSTRQTYVGVHERLLATKRRVKEPCASRR